MNCGGCSGGGLFNALIVGLLAGCLASWWVARIFFIRSLLYQLLEMLIRLAPMRKESIRGHDGLDDTAHAFGVHERLLKVTGYQSDKAVD